MAAVQVEQVSFSCSRGLRSPSLLALPVSSTCGFFEFGALRLGCPDSRVGPFLRVVRCPRFSSSDFASESFSLLLMTVPLVHVNLAHD